ncbi:MULTISPECIES: helix-turn-helix domain-containing protein [Bartonella]|uniref:helix-turn-helix domain-containing protein n=1 Tax=Bartonella TaxID=773 RepID=UPI0018DD89C0|nr:MULTISPECIES: helix-turn-helix transcriptional regulator [Bartonella]MBI0141233.1 helix-turn-helix transcriptional regulator [Bartonella choladocola]MBI0177552.1 helix-turn-helix transcriptional regulator [Bartonella apis]
MARPERIKTVLGQRLRLIRQRNGNLDRDVFAKNLGINAKTLANYERGDSAPDAPTLAQYQKLYGININWLLSGAGDMTLNGADTMIDNERLTMAISAVEEGLQRVKKTLQPNSKAELIAIAYKILGSGEKYDATDADNIIRLIAAK